MTVSDNEMNEAAITEVDTEKRMNFRRLMFGLSVSANHALICLFYYASDYMRLSLNTLLVILTIIWLGNLSIFLAFWSGKTAKFKDPALTVPLMLWIGLGILVTAYYMQGFRLSVLMLLFGVMLLGAFRVSFKPFLLVALATIVGYATVLYLVIAKYSEQIDTTVEVIELLMFTMVTVGMVVTVTRITALQQRLVKQGNSLNTALAKVHELAIRDELTGLYNRRRILELLREQINLANSGDYCFVICYLDLDHFKLVNDTYGHGVGDEVIKRFAVVAEANLRSVDYAGRLGGEEFIVVLTKTQLDEALVVAERIRAGMEAERYDDMPSDTAVTVSIGAAQFMQDEDLEGLLNRADANLYISKDTGRNKITSVIADSSELAS